MNFHLSWLGVVYMLATIGPNLIWTRHKPEDYDKYVVRESALLRALERTGETLVACTVLITGSGRGLLPLTGRSLWLAASIALMVLYELFWLRYFRGENTMERFYGRFLGIPVPGALLPVAAFFLLAVYDRNPLLGVSVIILAVGHIGIHLAHAREVRNGLPEDEQGGERDG